MGQQSEYTTEIGRKLTSNLPTGTITLLFTDIEKSTLLLRQLGEQYTFVLETSRHLLRTTFQQWHGHEVDMQGDAFFVVFARATDAVAAAVTAQRLLYTHPWPEGVAVKVRMGLHTGEPEHSSESYVGLDVHYAARLMNAAHGGQVLLSRTTRELVEYGLPEGVSLLDLGLYHLKDIPGPRSIFQLVIADLSVDFPPPNALDIRFHNLPVQLTSLIGREREKAALCALLQRTDVRLVTLTGTGGIGKTRLGLQVATDLLDSFADGVYFVPLAPVTSPASVIPTIAHWLGLERRRTGQLPRLDQEHMEYLHVFLRDKHVLLLLDNFEQVVTAASDLVDLLAGCPHLKILVTSRAVLHISGEHEFAVPPLALPERTHLGVNEDLAQYAAVALFLERALAIKPDLALTKANLRAIAAICRHLDGLPLAIELAAARIKLLPPRALLQRLTHRLTVLTGGTQDVPVRQQTLRNTIAWSYNLLGEAEQQLFRCISIFVGGCTLEAIEAIASASTDGRASILDAVTSLIDKSLLQQMEQEEEEPRLIMLETIREYGLEALSTYGEEETTRQAHAAYYLALAERAEPHYGGPEQTVWLERLEREHDNLRAALLWSLEQAGTEMTPPRIETALRLGGALRRFWLVHAHVTEGRNFLEQALTTGEKAATPVRAKALIAAANLAVAQNDYERTEVLCQQSLTLFRELADQPGIAFSLQLQGSALWNRGNPATGRSLTEEALMLFRKIGDKSQTAWALTQLALLDSSQGQYSRAYALFEEGLALHREMGHKRGIAFSLVHLARLIFISQGDQVAASSLLEEGLPLFRELGDKDGIASSYALRGWIALGKGNTSEARSLLEESVKLHREVGSRQSLTESLILLARTVVTQGDNEAASTLYKESLTIARALNHQWLIASVLEGLATMVAGQGEIVWAARLWGKAEALREAISVSIPPVERADYERAVAASRTQLSEKAFAAAWTQGRMLPLEQILTAQGQQIASPLTTIAVPPSSAHPAGLTTREVQILRLVARGLTSSEVAEELGLSEKTVSHHLTHIFNKTNSENRAAAAAFAIRHGLA